MISRVCVNCGSNSGADPAFMAAARDLGECLASREITLVYGGSNVGIMGAVANATLEGGGNAVGVIPESLFQKVGHQDLTEQYVVSSMHERKQKMFDLSDAYIILPGGYGTFEEMFEILTWAQLGMHLKPVGILNVAGYYDALLTFLDSAVHNRFVSEVHRNMLLVDSSPGLLLDRLEQYEPVVSDKWLDRREET